MHRENKDDLNGLLGAVGSTDDRCSGLMHNTFVEGFQSNSFWRPTLAAATATCTGIGLARFAYVPLFPAMVAAGWVDGGEAGLIGAGNLAGYLSGVLFGRRLASRIGTSRVLDLGMILAASAFAFCAINLGLWWFLLWRGLAGVAGGLLMAVAGPAAQASVPQARRGFAGGIVISGVGCGVSLASVLAPAFLNAGLAVAWLGLAGLVALLLAVAHPFWPRMPVGEHATQAPSLLPYSLLLTSYGLSGAGMVAPMIYLADLAVRGRGFDMAYGAAVWLVFGLGGMIGTLAAGGLVDRFGARRCFRAWLVLQVVGLALALIPVSAVLPLAALICGAAAIGITAVVLSLVRERAGRDSAALWARTTAAYGVAQVVTAFPLATAFTYAGEDHLPIFAVGLGLSVFALAIGFFDR